MIKILIADDHLIIRQGLRLILETEEDFEISGEATNGIEALQQCASLHPDVVLMDLRMPGMDGITAIEKLRQAQPKIAVVILTTFSEDDLMLRGIRAGAKGFLLKDTDRASLFDTIRAAARGETLLKPEIMSRLLDAAAAPDEALDRWTQFHAAIAALPGELREVFHLVWYLGADQPSIARLLDCSERTGKSRWREAREAVRAALEGKPPG